MAAEESLSRDQVQSLLDEGVAWTVNYCWGADRPPESGQGAPLPPGVLDRVKKRRRGKAASRTYFYAIVVPTDDGRVLALDEG